MRLVLRRVKNISGILVLGICLCCTAAAKKPSTKYHNISGTAARYKMALSKSDKKIFFSGYGRTLQMETSSRRIAWNGMPLVLGYPVVWNKNGVLVSESDWFSTLNILFNPGSVPGHRLRTITLDAGHGGNDRGASGKFSKEKDITLKLTRRVADILTACNYRVHLTRSKDVTLTLKERTARQRAAGSDLFVSIHVNASPNKSAAGIETYCLTPADAPSTVGKFLLQKNPANRFDVNNFALACRLQHFMVKKTGAVNRGVRRARFAVLRDIAAPGVLIEIGFISNAAEEKLLNNPFYMENLARGIAAGIVSYHDNLAPRRY